MKNQPSQDQRSQPWWPWREHKLCQSWGGLQMAPSASGSSPLTQRCQAWQFQSEQWNVNNISINFKTMNLSLVGWWYVPSNITWDKQTEAWSPAERWCSSSCPSNSSGRHSPGSSAPSCSSGPPRSSLSPSSPPDRLLDHRPQWGRAPLTTVWGCQGCLDLSGKVAPSLFWWCQ